MPAPPLDPAAAAVLEHLDDAELVSTLAELVRVPSVTGSAAESELQHTLAGWLVADGLDVDLWPIDLVAVQQDPEFPGLEAERDEAYGLVGVLPGTDTDVPGLVLAGHTDVVPIGDPTAWVREPFGADVRAGVLHGRGACDMKAGVAAMIAVARAVRRSGVRLAAPLALHCVVGEEDGGLGAFATLRRGHTGSGAVIPEPTAGRVITATAGALTFEVEVPGLAAHGSMRHEGVSAVDGYLPIHRALADLEDRRHADVDPRFVTYRRPYPISVGRLRAGDWSSTVPDRLVAEGRYGVRLGEDPAQARADFEAAVADAAQAASTDGWWRDHPPVVRWPGGQFAPGELPPGHPLLDEVRAACEVAGGGRPAEDAAPYGSDLRLYAAAGIPTVHYGPGDPRVAHSPEERVDLDAVVEVARALTVLAVRRCGARLP